MNILKILPNAAKFVEHKIALFQTEAITAVMFEYLMAGNGVFIRAKRREFSVFLNYEHKSRSFVKYSVGKFNSEQFFRQEKCYERRKN